MESPHVLISFLEPTRTGIGSPGAKIESEVGVRRHEPEFEGGARGQGGSVNGGRQERAKRGREKVGGGNEGGHRVER